MQAGMGGGCAGHRLAAAVSEAGGLGTIGTHAPDVLRAELEAARRLTAKPIAVNLLLPFVGEEHWRVAAEADVVVTFAGPPRRRLPIPWLHQSATVADARRAQAAGADGVIVQGVEAGGHVLGTTPGLELLARVRGALSGLPALLAGGIVDRAGVEAALEAGAEAAVLGTRFVASAECPAHRGYKDRLVAGTETILTELFGLGWAAPHRVVPNEATRRWCGRDRRGPAAVRALNSVASPLARRLPQATQDALLRLQRPHLPLLSPRPPLADGPANLVDSGPLYAGEGVGRIESVRPAAELVRDLAPG